MTSQYIACLIIKPNLNTFLSEMIFNAKVNKSTSRLKPAGLARKHCNYNILFH